MADDERKLTYSERDKLRRDGGGHRQDGHQMRQDKERSRAALKAADSLFAEDGRGAEAKALVAAVQAAHGSADLPAACHSYVEQLGPPATPELVSIFLDSRESALTVMALDELLRWKEEGRLELQGGLKRQIRILAEDFDDELASRAEELLE